MSAITVTPDPFTLVPYDTAVIRALLEEAVALAGIPPTADIALTVDEELFAPLTGHMSDVSNGRVVLWISGANFEDNKRPCHFSAEQARLDLAVMALRANDRLSGDFADAPPDAELSRGERAAWDTYAVGRAQRLGLGVRRPRQLYDFRLQHGFTDVADAAFERCWQAEHLTWDGIREICKETGATDRGRVQGPDRPPPPEVATPGLRVSALRGLRPSRSPLFEVSVIRGRRPRSGRRGRSRASTPGPAIAARAMSVMSGESRCSWTAAADSHFSITRNRPGCVTEATRSTLRHAGSCRVITT